MIIGKVTIGNNFQIGAGSLVMKDVPANTCYYDKNPYLHSVGKIS